MWLVAVQGVNFVQFAEFAVNTHLGISAFAHLLDQILVVSFASTHDRSEKVAFASSVILHYQGYDLLVRVTHHFLACLGRVCCGGAGI